MLPEDRNLTDLCTYDDAHPGLYDVDATEMFEQYDRRRLPGGVAFARGYKRNLNDYNIDTSAIHEDFVRNGDMSPWMHKKAKLSGGGKTIHRQGWDLPR